MRAVVLIVLVAAACRTPLNPIGDGATSVPEADMASSSCCGGSATGNELGIGKACQPGGDCGAGFCSTNFFSTAHFCTRSCFPSSSDCGAGAACRCADLLCACVPMVCLRPPSGC